MALTDDTWKFWVQFILEDALAYVGLFLAIRGGDWQLRMTSLKLMAPIFTAFDHNTYQKLISQHVADVLSMPLQILTMFQQGAFVLNISGRSWHSVAIDEGHEMLINKECKGSLTKPSHDYINRIAHYIPYRTKALENLKQQIFPEQHHQEKPIQSPFSSKSNDFKSMENIKAMISTNETHHAFCDTTRVLAIATPVLLFLEFEKVVLHLYCS